MIRSISFEFFPPKTAKLEAKLWQSIEQLAPIGPKFVSVTYGAGGSTRTATHKIVNTIISDTELNVAAHLTCVSASKEEVDSVIDDYKAVGVNHIVALRGDMPDMGLFQPHPEWIQFFGRFSRSNKETWLFWYFGECLSGKTSRIVFF